LKNAFVQALLLFCIFTPFEDVHVAPEATWNIRSDSGSGSEIAKWNFCDWWSSLRLHLYCLHSGSVSVQIG